MEDISKCLVGFALFFPHLLNASGECNSLETTKSAHPETWSCVVTEIDLEDSVVTTKIKQPIGAINKRHETSQVDDSQSRVCRASCSSPSCAFQPLLVHKRRHIEKSPLLISSGQTLSFLSGKSTMSQPKESYFQKAKKYLFKCIPCLSHTSEVQNEQETVVSEAESTWDAHKKRYFNVRNKINQNFEDLDRVFGAISHNNNGSSSADIRRLIEGFLDNMRFIEDCYKMELDFFENEYLLKIDNFPKESTQSKSKTSAKIPEFLEKVRRLRASFHDVLVSCYQLIYQVNIKQIKAKVLESKKIFHQIEEIYTHF